MPTPQNGVTSSSVRQARGWLFAGLLVLFVLALGNFRLLSGSAAPQWDAADFFGPQFALVGDQIRSGQLLKWDPWVGAGGPDLAEPELGTTSPILLTASFLSINAQEGYIAYWMAVWAFGGIGFLLLTRYMGCPVWGGTIAALGFVASGFYTGHAEHMSSIYSVSFLSWIVWRLEAGLTERRWWCGVQAGALYGLSALGGYPAFTIMTPGFLFLWTAGRVMCRESGLENQSRRSAAVFAAVLLIAIIVVGFVIFCPPYSAILLNTRGYSDHIGPRARDVSISSNLLAAGAISTLASPYLALLNFPPKALWPETNVSMTSLYMGAASLVLALFGLRRRSSWRWWLMLMAAFFLCFTLGSQLPLRGWLYDFVPPTRYFRNPALFRAYIIFIIGILAALATRDLAEAPISEVDRVRLWLLSTFLAFSGIVCFFVVVRIAPQSMPEQRAGILHLMAVWISVLVLTYAAKESYLSIPNFMRLVAMLAVFDAASSLYISQPTLYTSATVPWWHEMNAHYNNSADMGSAGLVRAFHPPEVLGSYPNNRNILSKSAVFDSYITLWNRFQQQMALDPLLAQMAVGGDRFWFSSTVAHRSPDDASFKRYRERIHELEGQPILLVHSREQMLSISPAGAPEPIRRESLEPLNIPACTLAPVSDVSYKPNWLSFRYTAPTAGYLLVTERWGDGWEATINGQPAEVQGANFIFRAVKVDMGQNLVEFRYNPPGFWPLLFVSWGTLALIAVWQFGRLLLQRRGPPG